ncbi:MAG: aspartate/glutamate racemase family protein [Proteobacteria bacterium]|nr:aspartate/glutamate racemase family protein [Pseudomonadota bacterium]
MPVFKGGRTIYGEAIGILLLETRFARMPGDIGNATTFDFPVRIKVVKGATVQKIIMEGNSSSSLKDFIAAAKELEADGVRAITTSCGYLTTIQQPLIEAVNIPVYCSSLLQVPTVARMMPKGKKVAILTLDSRKLTRHHLELAGITNEELVFIGAETTPEFYNNCAGIVEDYDPADVERGVVDLVKKHIAGNKDVGAIVCEGINFAPYAAAVQEAVNLPWFDIVDMTKWVYAATVKQRYRGHL